MESRFDAEVDAGVEYQPRFNIAPGEHLEVITHENPDTIDQYHWGLIPFWADEIDDGLINARSETAHEKRSFTDAWEHRPCIVLSSGFYEWQSANGGPKQPYRIYRWRKSMSKTPSRSTGRTPSSFLSEGLIRPPSLNQPYGGC